MPRFLLTCFITSLCLPTLALAQEPPEPDTQADQQDPKQLQAVALFKAAVASYNASDWGQASELFMQAYRAFPRASFLFSAAKSREKISNNSSTLTSALDLVKKAQAQTTLPLSANELLRLKEFRKGLEARIEQERINEQRLEAQKLKALRGNPDSYQRMGTMGWIGVGTMVAGALTLGASGYYNNEARLALEAQTDSTERVDYDVQVGRQEDAQGNGLLTLGVGSALLVAGSGLLIWELVTLEMKPEVEQQLAPQSVSLGVTPSSATITWRF